MNMLTVEKRPRRLLDRRRRNWHLLAPQPGVAWSTNHSRINQSRWYDPSVGRWLGQDPIGFDGGDDNLYGYCDNGPTDGTDPNGLVFEALVAEAIKTLMEGYHNNDSGDVLKEVSDKLANRAVDRLIEVGMSANFDTPQRRTVGNPPIKGDYVTGHVPVDDIAAGEAIVNTIAFSAPRQLAGTLGFNVDVIDAEVKQLIADSNAGKLTVTEGGKTITLTVLSSGNKGDIRYSRFKADNGQVSQWWVCRYYLVLGVRRSDNGQTQYVKYLMFVKSGFEDNKD
jgi:hypothetical protein